MNTALLLVGIQNDYFPNGRMPLDKSDVCASKAQEALQACRNQEITPIHIQHISTRSDAVHLLPCTKGIEFHSSVQPLKNELIIKKHYPNSFKDTNLLSQLQKLNIQHLVIAGMMTHLCIDATIRDAYDRGFTCTLLHDACATRNLEFNNMIIPAQSVNHAFLAALQRNYASVLTVKEWLQKINVKSTVPA